jgi:phage baseplate assembly protein W
MGKLMTKEIALSLPFTFDSFKKVGFTSDQNKIWADRVRIILGTNLRERLMRPDFGSLIPSTFMGNQEETSTAIESEVNNAFATQITELKLQDVSSSFDEYTGVVSVEVSYTLPNLETTNTAIAFITLNNNQPAYEENL